MIKEKLMLDKRLEKDIISYHRKNAKRE